MIYLRSVSIRPSARKIKSFPFNLPLLRSFKEIQFHQPVTFFVGENGTGKSTLLEAIAAGVGSIAVGGADLERDTTLQHARSLSKHLKFVWQHKARRGFFLRAEDFFNFARRVNAMSQELDEMAGEFDQELTGYALGLAKGAVLGQK